LDCKEAGKKLKKLSRKGAKAQRKDERKWTRIILLLIRLIVVDFKKYISICVYTNGLFHSSKFLDADFTDFYNNSDRFFQVLFLGLTSS